ncbi:TlpA disulfide reductase family protein [Paenibacillus qinlingensis]|uniref:Peptide methionine sulfoxide reductase msrA/msrB n=1 Tax=Paenibacillus qinlingensis TaxID=1837343 RepID=A0ABU1P675_9BACL|nr:TlpA disulfide reductase family protein [Paenibacillus qinlingensis]MDR6554841.1 peptide methionine sulfoxide reductase msrA/msrB [Paenibacillus qinlingensis]
MMIKRNWMITTAILLTLLILTACGSSQAAQSENSPQAVLNKGQAAPPFTLKDLDGKNVDLASFAGEKVYVKYWASWCSICLAGLDEIDELASQDNDFKVITIVNPNYRGEQSSERFTKWFKGLQADQTGTHLTVLLDEDGKWAQKFGVRAYPSSYYIGSDGILAKSVPGHNANSAILNNFGDIH